MDENNRQPVSQIVLPPWERPGGGGGHDSRRCFTQTSLFVAVTSIGSQVVTSHEGWNETKNDSTPAQEDNAKAAHAATVTNRECTGNLNRLNQAKQKKKRLHSWNSAPPPPPPPQPCTCRAVSLQVRRSEQISSTGEQT